MRGQPRYSIKSKSYLKTYDSETGFLIGYVMDLSESGLRIVSDQAIAMGKTMQIRIQSRVNANEVLKFKLLVRCQWSCHDLTYDHHEVGLHILEPSKEFDQIVAKLRMARDKEISAK